MPKSKMTLDEAIQHAEDVSKACALDSPSCSEDHAQLACWLRELKKFKEKYGENSSSIDQIGNNL